MLNTVMLMMMVATVRLFVALDYYFKMRNKTHRTVGERSYQLRLHNQSIGDSTAWRGTLTTH